MDPNKFFDYGIGLAVVGMITFFLTVIGFAIFSDHRVDHCYIETKNENEFVLWAEVDWAENRKLSVNKTAEEAKHSAEVFGCEIK